MDLERIGRLLTMGEVVTRSVYCYRLWGAAAEIVVTDDELAPDMRDLALPIAGTDSSRLSVVKFFDALAERYADELAAIDMIGVMPRRRYETQARKGEGQPGDDRPAGGRGPQHSLDRRRLRGAERLRDDA